MAIVTAYRLRMSLPPDQPPTSSSAKPKLTPEEHRARQADRLTTIRLRMLIGRELEERGITTPAAIGAAFGTPGVEAVRLLIRHQWRGGGVAPLHAPAARRGGWEGPGPGPYHNPNAGGPHPPPKPP